MSLIRRRFNYTCHIINIYPHICLTSLVYLSLTNRHGGKDLFGVSCNYFIHFLLFTLACLAVVGRLQYLIQNFFVPTNNNSISKTRFEPQVLYTVYLGKTWHFEIFSSQFGRQYRTDQTITYNKQLVNKSEIVAEGNKLLTADNTYGQMGLQMELRKGVRPSERLPSSITNQRNENEGVEGVFFVQF